MSTYNDPGPPSPYIPPPPPPARRGRSPWLWIGLGCGLLSLVVFAGCTMLLYVGGKQIADEVQKAEKKPLTEKEVLLDLKEIPIYPGSKVDLPLSKKMRGVSGGINGILGRIPGQNISFSIGAFTTPAVPEKVVKWYDTKFKDWRQTIPDRPQKPGGNVTVSESRQYTRAGTQVSVEIGQAGGGQKSSKLILTVIRGMPQQ